MPPFGAPAKTLATRSWCVVAETGKKVVVAFAGVGQNFSRHGEKRQVREGVTYVTLTGVAGTLSRGY